MAIPRVSRTEQEVRIVYVGDPDVVPNDPAAGGWIRYEDATVKKGADVLTVTGLNKDQRDAAVDGGGPFATSTLRCRAGIRSVNGSTDSVDIERFIETAGDVIVFLAGCYIREITDGEDPAQVQTATFRRQHAQAAARVEAPEANAGEG